MAKAKKTTGGCRAENPEVRLRKLRLFASLSSDEVSEVVRRLGGGIRRFAKGEVILHEGVAAKWLMPVLSGIVSVYEPGANGERHLVRTVESGQLFGATLVTMRLERYPGMALAAAGIETDHVLVRSRPELGRFAGIEAAAFEKFRDYPRKKYPDVFFIWDTFVARGFFMALQNLGVRIPEDVFVVAQTNRGLGLSSPCTVTRFEADGVTDGKTVAEFALASLQKGRIPNVPSVGREYVIGGTFPC